MGVGKWSSEKRTEYNMIDAVSRSSIHVFQNSWTAILLTFDNCGMWNLKSEILERSYLGQQLYFSVQSGTRSLEDEYTMPDHFPLCGKIVGLPIPPPNT